MIFFFLRRKVEPDEACAITNLRVHMLLLRFLNETAVLSMSYFYNSLSTCRQIKKSTDIQVNKHVCGGKQTGE